MAGRILVLDDEENYAAMLKDLLCEHNYRVDMATRPERAVSQLEEIPYDLVISDYKMPVMDGADFLKRSRELYPNLPFILVSGLMNTPELVKVANMSVTLVLEKPLDTAAFLEQVARFSTPMTEEEMAGADQEQSSGDAASAVTSYPEDPRFFSASSAESKHFLLQAWTIASEGNALYIMQTKGGDGELAAKDLSQWKGNGDMPISSFFFPDSVDDAVEMIADAVSDVEKSNTIVVRLQTIAQLSAARTLVDRALVEVPGANSMLLVFVLSFEEEAAFQLQVGDQGVVLPPLSVRPSDLACYAKRFAKMAADRAGKAPCAEFTEEAVYQLLAHDWARDYKQLQNVIMGAVNASFGDQPLGLDEIQEALDAAEPMLSPEKRLHKLMSNSQQRYLQRMVESQEMTPSDLGKALEIDQPIATEEDLKTLPLQIEDDS